MSPVVAALIGGVVGAAATLGLGVWRGLFTRRQEVIATLRWAAERADATDGVRSAAIATIEGLVNSGLVAPRDTDMVLGVYHASCLRRWPRTLKTTVRRSNSLSTQTDSGRDGKRRVRVGRADVRAAQAYLTFADANDRPVPPGIRAIAQASPLRAPRPEVVERNQDSASVNASRILEEARAQAEYLLGEAQAQAAQIRAESETELAAFAARRDSINAQLANVRQMLATLTGAPSGVPRWPESNAPAHDAETDDHAPATDGDREQIRN